MQEVTTNNINNEDKKEEGRVMDAIKKHDLKMRPQWYFTLRGASVIFSVAVLLLLLLYIVSFIIFALHQSGAWAAAGFGPSGWSLFLAALPWGMFILSIVLLISLASILKRYAFVYHQPIFIFLVVFILAVTIAGFLLAATSFPEGFSRYATSNIPFLEGFYESETAMPASVHRGEIVMFVADGFVIDDGSGMTSTVVAAPGLTFLKGFHVGDLVLVFGTRQEGDVIRAFGIQRIAVAVPTTSLPIMVPTTSAR